MVALYQYEQSGNGDRSSPWKQKVIRRDYNSYRGIAVVSVSGKILSISFILRSCSHCWLNRDDQPRFMLVKSTIYFPYCFSASQQELLTVCVDLKMVFDLVHRETPRDPLRLLEVLAK